jgi:hypothetical protein
MSTRTWSGSIDPMVINGSDRTPACAYSPSRTLTLRIAPSSGALTTVLSRSTRAWSRVAFACPSFASASLRWAESTATEIAEVIGIVADHRFVTLTGTGGIGKTRLALEVARQLMPQFPDGVWIAELASLSDPQLVPVTIAAALGVELASGVVSPERVAAALGSKHIMLVLDNCEHVIHAAAGMVEALLHANPAARVIATSREPLRADGERVYRVPPLGVPTEGTQALEEVLRHGAVALFVARARAADPHFTPDRQTAAAMSSICRQLDGRHPGHRRHRPRVPSASSSSHSLAHSDIRNFLADADHNGGASRGGRLFVPLIFTTLALAP